MDSSIGVVPGDRMVDVVELDGSYRKTRLLNVSSTEIGLGADPMRPESIADAVREALDGGVTGKPMKGRVTLGYPCREAVLRTLELPFKGADAIKKVVKSEVEGEIFTHSVEDMVVDFHEVSVTPAGGTKIMIAAVPKVGIRNQIESLSANKIDPESIDLDTMALWRVADWVGAFESDDDGDADADAEKPIHAALELGAKSVKIILTEGDNLIEARVLRLGYAAVAEQVAREHGFSVEQAQGVVGDALRSGADVHVDADAAQVPVDSSEDDGDGEPADASAMVPATTSSKLVSYSDVEAAHTRFLQRLARELTRFMAATGLTARVRSVWITGEGSQRPGAHEMIEAVFGVVPQALDVFANMTCDLDEDEITALSPTLAIAVGHALGRMGGPDGFELRQEDLSLTGGFDRIKYPLAIACMVGLLTLFVFANQKGMLLRTLELELGQLHENGSFHGQLNTLFQGKWFQDKNYFGIKKGRRVIYAYKQLVEELAEAPVHRRLRIIRDKLKKVAKDKQKESGVYDDISLESGLAVLVRWAEVMKSIEPELGRYLVGDLNLNMNSGSKGGSLKFIVAFRGDDFRLRKSVIESAFKREWGKPDSPFMEPEKVGSTAPEKGFSDIEEKGIPGAYYTFTIRIRPSFQPFGPSARIGALLQDEQSGQPVRGYLAAAMGADQEVAGRREEVR